MNSIYFGTCKILEDLENQRIIYFSFNKNTSYSEKQNFISKLIEEHSLICSSKEVFDLRPDSIYLDLEKNVKSIFSRKTDEKQPQEESCTPSLILTEESKVKNITDLLSSEALVDSVVYSKSVLPLNEFGTLIEAAVIHTLSKFNWHQICWVDRKLIFFKNDLYSGSEVQMLSIEISVSKNRVNFDLSGMIKKAIPLTMQSIEDEYNESVLVYTLPNFVRAKLVGFYEFKDPRLTNKWRNLTEKKLRQIWSDYFSYPLPKDLRGAVEIKFEQESSSKVYPACCVFLSDLNEILSKTRHFKSQILDSFFEAMDSTDIVNIDKKPFRPTLGFSSASEILSKDNTNLNIMHESELSDNDSNQTMLLETQTLPKLVPTKKKELAPVNKTNEGKKFGIKRKISEINKSKTNPTKPVKTLKKKRKVAPVKPDHKPGLRKRRMPKKK